MFWAFLFLFLAAALMTVLSVVFWVLANFTYPIYDNTRLSKIEAINGGQQLQVEYPQIILLNDMTTKIRLSWYFPNQPVPPAANLTVSFQEVPSQIRVISSEFSDVPDRVTVQIPVNNPNPSVIDVEIINTGQIIWVNQSFSLVLTTPNMKPIPMSLEVESLARAQFRELADKQLFNENSLPIYFVGLIFSLAGTIFSKGLEKVADEETKTTRDLDTFYLQMTLGNVPEAVNTLWVIKEHVDRGLIDAGRYELATRLIKISQGTLDLAEASDVIQGRPNEAGGALLYSLRQSNSWESLSQIRQMVNEIYFHKLVKSEIKEPLQEALDKIDLDRQPKEARRWPILPEHWSGLQSLNKNTLHKKLFFSDKADDFSETSLLFSEKNALFWSDHPLYQTLVNADGPHIIWGEHGTGRTALAKALGQYHIQERTWFGCYLATLGDGTQVVVEKAMIQALASQALAFICANPEWLILSQAERKQLAGLLVSALDTYSINSNLERASRTQQVIKQAAGQNSLKDIDQSWGLRLLRQEVEQWNQPAISDLHQWIRGLAFCTRSMRFDRWRIVLDAPYSRWYTWMERFLDLIPLLRQIETETQMQMDLLLFLPDNPFDKKNHTLPRWPALATTLPVSELHWRPSNNKRHPLWEMTEWRLDRMNEQCDPVSYRTMAEICTDEMMKKLTAAAINERGAVDNPRQFIRQWNRDVATLLENRLPADC